ncbi:MAG: DCC1-like thiol-disulfide oxidoreductase family protein [Mariniphaga sp.]
MNQDIVILFDGCCHLCNGVVQFILKKDGKKKFKFSPLQSESGHILLRSFDLPIEDFNTFVLIRGDKYDIKSTAGLLVFRELGGFWKLLYLLILIPRPLRDFIYTVIAKNRYKIWGKRDTCMAPTADTAGRFLL